MTRPRAYFHSNGVICARGGLTVSEDMALALCDVYRDELQTAFRAKDLDAVASAALLLTDLRCAIEDAKEHRKRQARKADLFGTFREIVMSQRGVR